MKRVRASKTIRVAGGREEEQLGRQQQREAEQRRPSRSGAKAGGVSAFRKRNIILTNLPWLMKTHDDNYRWEGRPRHGVGRERREEGKEGMKAREWKKKGGNGEAGQREEVFLGRGRREREKEERKGGGGGE